MNKLMFFVTVSLIAMKSYSLDCLSDDSDIEIAWEKNELIFYGIPLEAKLSDKYGEGLVEYKFKIISPLKGHKSDYVKVLAHNYEYQRFQIGYEYIVFSDSNGLVDLCNPSQPLRREWYDEGFMDRADIPQKTKMLVKNVFGNKRVQP